MKNFQFAILLSYIIGISCATDSLPCGDWEPYKDEKCFKIFNDIGTQTFEDAKAACSQQEAGASLVSIRSQEEQEFFSHFVFETNKVVDKVWLGAQRIKSNKSNEFDWIDGFNLDYSNWEKGHPTNQDCIQINSAYEFNFQNSKSVKNLISSTGEWTDVPCQKKNLVVCEKLQNWSTSRLQQILIDARNKFQDSLTNIKIIKTQLKNQELTITTQQSTINNLKQNPIPINFTYTQLSGQPDPKSLWPTVEWKDVTSEYSGLFFRAEGNNSATFGTIQEENAPRVTQIEHVIGNRNHKNLLTLQLNLWSEWLITGGTSSDYRFQRFFTSGGDVRPRNIAMRIWKRTG